MGTTFGIDHVPDPPLAALCHYDAHPRFDMEEQSIAAFLDRGVVDAHPPSAGTDVLAVSGALVARVSDRLFSSICCHAATSGQ